MSKTFRHRINEDKEESMRFDLRREQAAWKRIQRQNRRIVDSYLIDNHNDYFDKKEDEDIKF